MSVFICWSGDRSHKLADAVRDLLVGALKFKSDEDDVFVSDRIEKGVAWFDSIVRHLERSKAGVVCLTAENVDSPWLNFEAGALALRLATKPCSEEQLGPGTPEQPGTPRHRLFTLLHGVTGAELKGPLGAYQATSTTRLEMTEMIRSIARVLGKDDLQAVIEPKDWEDFEAKLNQLAVPARRLIPDLESLFQRKTFNEPLHRCADQAWLRRYDGARLTREQLASHLGRVRAACSAHERGLFEMLLAELDAYAMAIAALLLSPKPFNLGPTGELEMDPGIRTCCEDRRLAIRSLTGLLLQSLDNPLREEAVRFMGAETDEERKMIIHRLEGAIRRQWEAAREKAWQDPDAQVCWEEAIKELTGNRRPIQFRESAWDLDRIYYYLLVHYFPTVALRWEPEVSSASPGAPPAAGEPGPMRHDWLCAARDVELEVERYRARSKGGSLMPLTYALVALQQIDRQLAPDPAEARAAVNSALELVQRELGDHVLTSAAGRAIARVLEQMRASP